MTERKPKRDPKTAATASKQGPASSGDFEASVRRLGEIVEALEAGDLPLEESLKLFEEGIGLARTSQKVLDDAEQRVEQLLSVDEDGNPVTRPIDD
jgi:exodeoxyribonuclease VII small subunit